ncbi:hypothetical protein DAEQUDRAFT_689285 [Daedalea quercina L-15889]|uniref:Protein kinase domain-containing protein n=1 Tax=Daedalea quercina L-15889 TaxID=1314783 RepID=A0A165RB94_9APHY|nr:hypothetical protein DAEQUDRAFT_689285 [Daedalea quercina L-15889]
MPDTKYFVYFPHPLYPADITFKVPHGSKRMLSSLLRDALQDRLNMSFASHFDPTDFTFYKLNDLAINPIATLLERTGEWLCEHREEAGRKLLRSQDVGTIFPEGIDIQNVHLLLVTPLILKNLDDTRELEVDVREAMLEREEKTSHIRRLLPTPSDGVSSAGVPKVVNNHNDCFHAGRPDDNYGPPVALFNPTLGLLAYHLRHIDSDIPMIEPSDDDCLKTHGFMVEALSSSDNEEARLSCIAISLNALFCGWHLSWDKTISGSRSSGVFGGSPPFGILEVKSEAGLDGDASLRAGLSYAKMITDNADWLVRRRRDRSNCPAILISSMGDLLEIGIAVHTDGVHTDWIFSERLRLGFYRNENVLRIARVFKAVQIAVQDLSKFYANIDTKPHVDSAVSHLFPSPLTVPTYEGSVPSLTFTHRMGRHSGLLYLYHMPFKLTKLRRSGLYTAILSKPSGADDAPDQELDVVVKFTAEYNAEAHRILADAGLAPALHACVPVCDRLFMVVMDWVEGETLETFKRQGERVPYSVYADVKTAIELLHQHDLVFGDLRPSNIQCVCTSGGAESSDHWRTVLIDFDWAGINGRSFYPPVLDEPQRCWAPDTVQPRGLMQKEHDLKMLEPLKKLCHPNLDDA